jgi:hypothetical protein
VQKSHREAIFNGFLHGAVALRKMIQDIVYLNHSYILYLVYVSLNATAPAGNRKAGRENDGRNETGNL